MTASNYFGSKKRPAGKGFRGSGILSRAIDDLYKDVDSAFYNLERAVNTGWAACRLAYASNVAALAAAAIAPDTAEVENGDRVLLTAQAKGWENGIYVVSAKAATCVLTRATDLDAATEAHLGDAVWVTAGTVRANSQWRVTALPSTWGSAGSLTFTQQSSIVQRTTEAEFDALVAAGIIDGDRLKAAGLTQVNLLAAVAADAVDNAVVTKAFAAGAFGADIDSRAALADDFFTEAMVSTVGVGGKFAAGCLTTAGLSHLLVADAFTTAEFSGATRRFAAGAVDSAGATSLFAANAIPASKLEVGGLSAGINAGDIQFGSAAADTTTFAPALSGVLMCQQVTLPGTAGTISMTTGQKIKIVDFHSTHVTSGDGIATIQLQMLDASPISDAIVQLAAANSLERAAVLDGTKATITPGVNSVKIETVGLAPVAGVAFIYYMAVAP